MPQPTRTITIRRRWATALTATAVLALCAVPASDAWAAGHSQEAAATRLAAAKAKDTKRAKPVKKTRAPVRAVRPTVTRTVTLPPRDGETAWWPWGQVLHGEITAASGTGARALVVQRGLITAVSDTSITVTTSADDVAISWTVGSDTTVTGLPRARRPRPLPHPSSVLRPAEATDPTTSTTSTTSSSTTSSTSTSSAAPTAGLLVGQEVGLWGTGSVSAATATAIVVHRAPRATPTTTSSPTTSTSTSTTTSTTSSTDGTPIPAVRLG